MKKSVFGQMLVAALLLATASNLQAQSLKDLLNKENIEKAVNAVTGKNTASMTGTWMFPARPWLSNRTTCFKKPEVPSPPMP